MRSFITRFILRGWNSPLSVLGLPAERQKELSWWSHKLSWWVKSVSLICNLIRALLTPTVYGWTILWIKLLTTLKGSQIHKKKLPWRTKQPLINIMINVATNNCSDQKCHFNCGLGSFILSPLSQEKASRKKAWQAIYIRQLLCTGVTCGGELKLGQQLRCGQELICGQQLRCG